MKIAHEHFQKNIMFARQMVGLYAALQATTTPALDASDLLRNALVSAVSSFDYLVHELVRLGLLEIAKGRSKAKGTGHFSVSFANIVPFPTDLVWLDAEIRKRHGHLSFQMPDKVSQAVRLISDCDLFQEVAGVLGSSAVDIKRRLRLIVDRRNKIAHEADADPGAYGQKWPIDILLTNDSIDFIEALGFAVYQRVKL